MSLLSRVRALRSAEGGASALEFALIAPMFIITFFGLVEVGQAMIAGRRTSHAASTVGDLVAQQATVSTAGMSDNFAAGVQMMAPLPTSSLKMRVTSVTQQSNGKATVDWSEPYGMAADTKGAVYSVPAGMLTATGDSVVISTATYTLTQASAYVIGNGINYVRVTYAKPRNGSQVTHS